ncbi:uncharacterized protein LOC106135673 [Amyelois transitella]|uniref:uncharacterized protein LOC106135673 n=1 Tax=Amyelois transitella TaxID=680683 RepID=UPI00067DC630|nr:uncharacterized protein LOC106135673 [Amyelois transitella]
MDLRSQILLYLDQRRITSDMKIACEQFLNEVNVKTIYKYPPFRYVLEIDVMDLLETSPVIGETLLQEPLRLQNICNEILFACLVSLNSNEWTQHIRPNQVAVNIRLNCLSKLLVIPNRHHYKGLVSFEGLLVSKSKPESYAYHTVWSCPEECEDSEVVLQYIPKMPPKCYVCKTVLFENSGLRRCGEQVKVTMKIKNSLLSKNFRISDDLIPILKIGSVYIFYGIIFKKITSIWSLEEVVPLPAPITTPIPEDVEELFKACKEVSWKFIYCLASSIGINVCPLSCFMHLKISLLLSLTSVKANMWTNSRIIHVFAAGYDTGFVGKLMNEAAKLAPRFVYMGTSSTTTIDTLIGSSGGICFLSLPLHIYNQKQIHAILSALETGDILNDAYPAQIQCAVWAQGMDYKKILLYNVANIFGFVCRGDFGEYNDEIIGFMLEQTNTPLQNTKEEVKALDDVANYLDIVAAIQVSLDQKTEILLRNYFLTARREGTRGVSVGSMGALVAICLTAARLCRRTVANVDDAVLAIWLHVSGSPEPRFAPDDYLIAPADIHNLKEVFKKFKIWLTEFTGISVP